MNPLDFALDVAHDAGEMLLSYQKQVMERKYTSRTHFRTIADEEIDGMVVERIRGRYPDYSILTEESGDDAKKSPYQWVVDAVDGTINLWSGLYDHFAFCISLNYEGQPILGVVNAVGRGQCYYAQKGDGAYCNNNRICVADVDDIAQVLMGIDSGKDRRDAHIPYLAKAYGPGGVTFAGVSACASVPLTLVGSGVLHAYLATSLSPEDMAASVIIIREAGGKVTNLMGEEWSLQDPSIFTANPALHGKLGSFFGIPQ